MLEFVQGDMFDTPVDVRVNTVNCVGVMGAGVALAFRQRYPDMFKAYQLECKQGRVVPGKMHVWRSLTGDWVVNFPTKRDWREPSRYSDIEAGLDDLREYLESVGPVSVALPALGCGHGGLEWERVAEMIRTRLSDVDAHVLVFSPTDSRRAGRTSAEEPTHDEIAELFQLGFQPLSKSDTEVLGMSPPIFGNGELSSDLPRWLALLPSKTPNERERAALESIAIQLERHTPNIPIALIYASKISEDIAEIFTRHGLKTVLLLPFGVLTRKPIAKLANAGPQNGITLLSSAAPSAKWSRALYAQTSELLRANAGAVLLSDPEPEWLLGSAAAKWDRIPISFVRYEQTPTQIGEALKSIGATAIGRRAEGGTPNLDPLLAAFSASEQIAGLPSHIPEFDTEQHERHDRFEHRVSVDLLELDEDRRREVIDLVIGCSPTQLKLDAMGLDDATSYALEEWLSRADARAQPSPEHVLAKTPSGLGNEESPVRPSHRLRERRKVLTIWTAAVAAIVAMDVGFMGGAQRAFDNNLLALLFAASPLVPLMLWLRARHLGS